MNRQRNRLHRLRMEHSQETEMNFAKGLVQLIVITLALTMGVAFLGSIVEWDTQSAMISGAAFSFFTFLEYILIKVM